ncbi:MAG TPA: LamG domain-containing protein, partial [Thermoguttaceae bacterium]|nr:LamG domain-containing protein [Thermoguttaceae bacterium]
LKLHADLNWMKKSGAFGGGNSWGGPPRDIKGPGPYVFTFTPQEKPDLGRLVLTVYLSTTGEWKDHTLIATADIPIGDPKGKSSTVTTGGDKVNEDRIVSGPDLKNPQVFTSNFLIEAFFKTARGQKDATLIQKMNDAGYALRVNEGGGVTFAAQTAVGKATLNSHRLVNDGQWHHVIAESDRKAGTLTIYIDGKQDAVGSGLGTDASLANDADLYVGGTPQGNNLDGAIEFLRIARGTLADAQTTIEELYAWEFDGPFLQDFTGRKRPADGGAAGAIDE